RGGAFAVDLRGEKTVTGAGAAGYAGRVEELLRVLIDGSRHWPPDDHLERDDIGSLPRVNVSVKPTAMASLYAPLMRDDGLATARARLRPILLSAANDGAFVHVDME